MDSDWNPVMQPYRDEVRKRWNDFLLMKYSDREHLEKAWTWEGQCALKEKEDPNAGTVEIVKGNFYQPANDPMGEWTGDVSPVRYADYMEFGIWQNRRFYQRMKAFLLSIGVRVPINASNLVAGAADVYGHIDGDVMENNSYFNHPLFPLTPDGYNVPGPSDYVKVNPLKIQTGVGSMATTILSMGSIAAVEGKPFLLSEWNEYGLNPFHSTSFMHTVAYACLNDWDGLILYNYQTSEKENEPEDEILSVFDSSLVIAGSFAKLCVPYITLYSFFVTDGTSVAIPTSTGKRSTFASSAMIQTLVSPLVKLSATIAVTSWPVCVTPSSTTPLSAHIMISPRFRSSKSEVPLIPAI